MNSEKVQFFSAEIAISKVKIAKVIIKGNSNILVKNLKTLYINFVIFLKMPIKA